MFGALGFLGDAGGAGGQTVQRRVVLAGGFQYGKALFGSVDVNSLKPDVLRIFSDAGWSVNSLSFSQDVYNSGWFGAAADAVGFTLDINLNSNFSANDARLGAKSVLENVFNPFTNGAYFTDVYVQIVSEAGVPITSGTVPQGVQNQTIEQAAATSPANVINTVQTAAVKTANQIATQGVVPLATQGLDTLLFGGQTFDLFGVKIPKLVIYGGAALIGIPLILDFVQGKRR